MIEQINASKVKKYVNRMELYEDNMNKAYAFILGQCTKTLKAKLEARKNWDETVNKIKNNAINLLKAIKEITHN